MATIKIHNKKRIATLIGLSLLIHFIGLLSPLQSRSDTPRLLNIHSILEEPAERTYFYSASGDTEKLLTFRKYLISQGAHKVNCFLPFVVVCDLPHTINYSGYLDNSDIVPLRETDIRSEGVRHYVFGPQWVKQCYAMAGSIPNGESRLTQDSPSFGEFLMPPLKTVRRLEIPISVTSSTSEERGIDQNSEFMIGDILAQLIFPESVGPQENWTDQAISQATSAAAGAMIYYQENFSHAPINFIVRTIPKLLTNLEPIEYSREEQAIWITDVMNNLGYQGGQSEYLDLINQFNNDWRILMHTDWVFTAFIVNSANDPDHGFGYMPRYIGFGKLGGPHLAIPYPAGGGGTYQFKQVFKYELGHVFWAHYETHRSEGGCNDFSGYLNFRNWNQIVSYDPIYHTPEGCAHGYHPVFCLMDIATMYYESPPCYYTIGMLGLIDENKDHIPDTVDLPPIVEFENTALETVLTDSYTLRFQVISQAVSNQNPNQNKAERIDYALPIKDVSYLINGAGPVMLLSEDGKYDETTEDVSVTLTELIPGLTALQIIPRNSMGATNKDTLQTTKRLYYLGLCYKHFNFDFMNEGIQISWYMLGKTFDAKFDLHRIETGPVSHDSLIVSDIQPTSPSSGLFIPFSCFDVNVVPGRKYRYYVEGTFSAVYHGRDTTITHRSQEFEVYASLHIGEGHILSAPSPNPFNDHTMISIVIPPTYKEAGTSNIIPNSPSNGMAPVQTVEEEIQTGVGVTIYNALGQRVKTLYSGWRYSTTLTISWDGTNNNNEKVPSGVYFIRAEAGPYTQVQKVLIIR